MSYETTIANAVSKAADAEWKSHRKSCVVCSGRDRPCQEGNRLWAAARDARRELADNRAADKLPIPGQETLY